MTSKPHIRPKVRSKAKKQAKQSPVVEPSADDLDALLEEARGRLDSLLINVGPGARNSGPSPDGKPPVLDKHVASKPVGILKKPKYTNNDSVVASETPTTVASIPQEKEVNTPETAVPKEEDTLDDMQEESRPRPAVKRFVLERDPSMIKPDVMPGEGESEMKHNPRAVEGYTPKSEEDVVISSFADLMDKAGMLPKTAADPISGAQVVEANMEFSVMSKQEFEEQEEEEEDQEHDNEDPQIPDQPPEVFQGRFDIFSDDEDDGSLAMFRPDPEDEGYYSDDGSDIMEMPAPEPRAFMRLWEALSAWITPQAVALVQEWEGGDSFEVSPDWVPIVDSSEIASSRCAGVMAMINMNLQRCLKELDQPLDVDRIAKHRLADLLRTFNYSRPTARIDTRMWRAITCVLLQMVLVLQDTNGTSEDLPVSVKAVGIKPEEYSYLTQASFKSLAAGM